MNAVNFSVGGRPLAYARGFDPSRDRKGVPMALRAAKGDEDALGQRGARAHACRLDTRVEAWLLRLTDRVFKGVPIALRAAEDNEDAARRNVARAFSRPCRHSFRHLGVEVGLDAARVGACATEDRVFNGAVACGGTGL